MLYILGEGLGGFPRLHFSSDEDGFQIDWTGDEAHDAILLHRPADPPLIVELLLIKKKDTRHAKARLTLMTQ